MAKLWDLPVLYIVENNQYAMGTSVERSSSETELFKRGISSEVPGKKLDGMNFIAVYEGIKEAVQYIKSGKGPMLIEVETYRYRGHSMSDPAKYRTKEEVDKYKKELNTNRERVLELMEECQRYEREIFMLRADKKRMKMEIGDFSQRQQTVEGNIKKLIQKVIIFFFRISENKW